jgi:hypothetical protein
MVTSTKAGYVETDGQTKVGDTDRQKDRQVEVEFQELLMSSFSRLYCTGRGVPVATGRQVGSLTDHDDIIMMMKM